MRIAMACGVIASTSTTSAPLLLASPMIEVNCELSTGNSAFVGGHIWPEVAKNLPVWLS